MESFDDGGLVTASNGSRNKGLVWYPLEKREWLDIESLILRKSSIFQPIGVVVD